MHERVAGSTLGTVREMLPWAAKESMKRRGPTGDVQRRCVTSRVYRHVARRNDSLGHAETLGVKMPTGDGLRRQLRARQDTAYYGTGCGPPKHWAPSPRCWPGARRFQDACGK